MKPRTWEAGAPANWEGWGHRVPHARHGCGLSRHSSHMRRGKRNIHFRTMWRCGCLTRWEAAKNPRVHRMGINTSNVDPEILKGVRVRLLDGAAPGSSWTEAARVAAEASNDRPP